MKIILILLLLTSCADPLCGYKGQGCGYIDSNPRHIRNTGVE